MATPSNRNELSQFFGNNLRLIKHFEQLSADIAAAQEQVKQINTDLTQINADVTQVQSDLTQLQADLTTAQGQITTILSDLSNLTLDSLNNVSAASPADGDLLQFSIANNQWEVTKDLNIDSVTATGAVSGQITDTSANLISSSTSLTDVSGSDTATLTNAPVSGDPTLFAVVSVNGVNYGTPLWLLP